MAYSFPTALTITMSGEGVASEINWSEGATGTGGLTDMWEKDYQDKA